MRILFRLLATFRFALKRLWAQRWISLITIIGFTIAVGLFMSVPLYSDGVNFRILEERLRTQTENRNRPPFTYLFTYFGSIHGTKDWEEIAAADQYMLETGSRSLGLPPALVIRHLETDRFLLFAPDASGTDYDDPESRLAALKFATSTDFENNIRLLEGSMPTPPTQTAGEPVFEVLVAKRFADETGFQPGERYSGFRTLEAGDPEIVSIEIAGIWEPLDPESDYWFYADSAYPALMYVPEEVLLEHIAPRSQKEITVIAWYLVMDGSGVGPRQVDNLLISLGRVERRLQPLLPETSTFIDPTDALRFYRTDVARLNRVLFAFNLPTVGLVLTFIGLVGTLWADRLRNQLAVLRSRGITFSQLIGSVLLEALLIGLISFLLGTLLSTQFATWMGRARSFLDFSSDYSIRILLSRTILLIGLGGAGLAVLAQILPTIPAARQTIIDYKLNQARTLKPPWWQRAYIDILLLAVSAYGVYTLRQSGSLFTFAESGDSDPFQNPLLFLLPALIIFAATLFVLRLLPWLMALIGRLLELTNSITLLQAARFLARSQRTYTTPVYSACPDGELCRLHRIDGPHARLSDLRLLLLSLRR